MNRTILTLQIQGEQDVVAARQRARQIAGLLEFDTQDQTRIATAVSEIARNAYHYGGGGKVEFVIEGFTAPQVFLICISDQGPGIPSLVEIIEGRYHSETGMGLGIIGARRLMDGFHIESASGRGTTVWLRKIFSRRAPLVTNERLEKLTLELSRHRPLDPLGEIQRQNQELLQTLEQLRERQQELLRLNRELEDTNRGVVALYAELDEKADHLRRADDMKSRFLSNMSHEFRTPLNSQIALTHLLLHRVDGELTAEQEKQVRYIRKASDTLLELVNDLLDLAKIEAGKTEIRPVEFEVSNLFSALRGMLRPLLVGESVNLVFDEPDDLPPLYTDEGKVSQILRNFLSNAIKFTERGEVRLTAELVDNGQAISFAVSDTGIGIAEDDQYRIFEEFAQLENPLQKHVKGTGLGLPLCRKLAELLGGSVSLTSQPGHGSTFQATIPITYQSEKSVSEEVTPSEPISDALPSVLVVEDNEDLIDLYKLYLEGTDFQILSVRSLREARRALERMRPLAIILDILLGSEDGWDYLAEMKANSETADIPIIVVTNVEDPQKGLALGANAYLMKPVEQTQLIDLLMKFTSPSRTKKILLIDDEETSRYLMKKLLEGNDFEMIEADGGSAGLSLAQAELPDLICLDLYMPQVNGFEVLRTLKANPDTHNIPVIIISSKILDDDERRQLQLHTAAILSKAELTEERLLEVFKSVI